MQLKPVMNKNTNTKPDQTFLVLNKSELPKLFQLAKCHNNKRKNEFTHIMITISFNNEDNVASETFVRPTETFKLIRVTPVDVL